MRPKRELWGVRTPLLVCVEPRTATLESEPAATVVDGTLPTIAVCPRWPSNVEPRSQGPHTSPRRHVCQILWLVLGGGGVAASAWHLPHVVNPAHFHIFLCPLQWERGSVKACGSTGAPSGVASRETDVPCSRVGYLKKVGWNGRRYVRFRFQRGRNVSSPAL